jgi:hypothetical protein
VSLRLLKTAIPQPIRREFRRQLEFIADGRQHRGLALLRLPLVGEAIATAMPTRGPTVLVTSLPRSGSSWVGRILGSARDALYLREPLTQSYLKRINYQYTPCFEWGTGVDEPAYDRFARLAFKGIPRFGPTMVPVPKQWSLRKRRQRRVVIKEVNPLVTARLWHQFHPKIVVLVRHPAPLALSFHALGWTANALVRRFTPQTLTTFGPQKPEQMTYWEQAGAFQAMTENIVASSLTGIDHVPTRYEDLCHDPLSEFERIFHHCDLELSDRVRREIEQSSHAKGAYTPGGYDTARNSAETAQRWRHEMKPEEIEQVRRGYFACRPLFYAQDADW